MRVPDENGLDKVEAMKHTYRKLKLECLVVLGGNGSQKTANLLREEGLNVVSLPKTIDNDLWGTDVTFGFQSAINVAANAIDCIHTTAASHGRVFIVEVMGHKVGWLTLYAGIAGGADIILLPEIPYDIDVIVAALKERSRQGKRFSILAGCGRRNFQRGCGFKQKRVKRKEKESGGISVCSLCPWRPDHGEDRTGSPRYRSGPHAERRRAHVHMTGCFPPVLARRQPN